MSAPSSLSSTSAAPVSFSGLASGLDTTSIIQKLMSIDQQPVTDLQNQVTAIQSQQQVYSQLASLVQSLQQASQTLDDPSTFQAVSATSSNTAVASVTTTGPALSGTYNLTVTQLAQADKLSSTAQAGTSSALGYSGTIVINGKSLAISASDTLTTIAQNINGLNAGVSAGIVNGGSNNSFLTLTANATGKASEIQLADLGGTALESLGLTNGTTAVRSAVTNGAQSYGFSSSTATLQSLLGSATSGSIQINGTSVVVNFATDSLQTIANNINTQVSGVTATVVPTTTNGTTTYRLQVTGSTGTPTFTDSGDVLQSLGILQQGVTNELVQGKDASFSLDNANLTSSSNTITTAIPGATITLLQGTPSSPGNSTLTFSQNTSGIVSNLQNFASAYNAVNDYINQESTFNSSTYQSGPLFGDSVAEQIQNQLSGLLFSNAPGYSGKYPNLASLGFTLNSTGDLSLDTTQLSNALATDPQDVANLFQASGQGSGADLAFVASTSATHPTNTGPYQVNVTQLATQASLVASAAQTQPASNAETLTFGGNLFNSGTYAITLNVGASLDQTVAQINADPTLSALLAAKDNNGSLELDSLKYGTPGNFTVTSNLAASSSDSGIGTAGQSNITDGLDIAGTINGEASIGSGQFLTGNSGNATTSGLEVQYTGTSTGIVGSMSYSDGIANQMMQLAQSFADPTTGLLTTENNSLNNQITADNQDIANLQAQLQLEQQNLTQEFQQMESAISALQAQGQSLGYMVSAMNGSSSSSSNAASNSSSSSNNSSSGSSGTSTG